MPDQSVRVVLQGAVQGCGVRPALARLAARHNWSGSVRNTAAGVELLLAGRLPDESSLRILIRDALPPAAECDLTCSPVVDVVAAGFRIEESDAVGSLATPIPRDLATCSECFRESRDPMNRRYRYPFTSCAVCGPRYSLLLAMPFDRDRTTMREFPLCALCRREYDDPTDRRFHAQTICCPECGPEVWTTDHQGQRMVEWDDAIRIIAEAVRQGRIAAVRGVGGYQLLADATSPSAVRELRRRKQRTAKPFAVLCHTLADARELAHLSEIEVEQLGSPQNPIVLVRQRSGGRLAHEVNPGMGDVGLMLPSTALHDRIVELAGRPLICTSGNRDGEPLASGVDEAELRLREIVDLFLHHNREISQPIDDSVVRVIAQRPVTIRCARGLAPLPLALNSDSAMLAVGGHQKGAVALSNRNQAVLGAHVGDLDTVSTQERWCENVARLSELTRTIPAITACDPHSQYFPTQWSRERRPAPVAVWHHHAHVVSGMVEHGWLDRTVLGVAFDGTGLGRDESIWGGEFLIATATRFQRVGHLRAFVLPGGEAAISDLRRLSVALLSQFSELSLREIAELSQWDGGEVSRTQQAMDSRFSPRTTSGGRLFDAAACLILGQVRSEFEGHAAMCLESACDLSADGEYSFAIDSTQPVELDWRPALRQIIADRRSGTPPGVMAMRFHRGLARAVIAICARWPTLPVVLSGGVFQNRVLVELLVEAWPVDGPPLGLPGLIPPNDGGLAVGQLAVASVLAREREGQTCASEFPDESPSGWTATR